MKDGKMKAFLMGGKNCKGATGVLAAVAGVAISVAGTILTTVIGNKLAYKADADSETEPENKELETTTEEVEEEPEKVTEEVNKKG